MFVHRLLILATLSALFAPLLPAQGPLIPPGPPSPGMKTLQQVEPRTDLATVAGDGNAMHIIDQPGSYYLTGNLDVTTTTGISIRTSGVTVDLMGFNVFRSAGGAATGTAIAVDVSGLANIAIRNGHITGGVTFDSQASGDQFVGPGFESGIRNFAGLSATNMRVMDVQVSGCDQDGINLGSTPGGGTLVERCAVQVAGGIGILAEEVRSSLANTCGGTAIFTSGNVLSSHGQSVGMAGVGIVAGGNVDNCMATALGAYGIACDRNVSDSTGISLGSAGSFEGIRATGNVLNSYGSSNTGNGIESAENVENCRGDSTSTSGSAHGIRAGNVSNSRGDSDGGAGIVAASVSNSYGLSDGGTTVSHGIDAINVTNSVGVAVFGCGVKALSTISFSYGGTSGAPPAAGLECAIAIGSTAVGGENITNKYLMP